MKYVQRKVTTAKSKHTIENFAELKQQFLEDVVTMVCMEEIPPELIVNWDLTRIKIVFSQLQRTNPGGCRVLSCTPTLHQQLHPKCPCRRGTLECRMVFEIPPYLST